MKKRISGTTLWDFCLFMIGAFITPIFTKLQALIASCDSGLFCVICAVITFAVISIIKK